MSAYSINGRGDRMLSLGGTPPGQSDGGVKERPILFSAPMVRGILEGRKTKTRRAVKPQPPVSVEDAGVIHSGSDSNGLWSWLDSKDLEWASAVGDEFRCPYGVPGDLLWVREAGELAREAYDHDPAQAKDLWRDAGWVHAADGAVVEARPYDPPLREWLSDCSLARRPSIHMPRWASRITLRITDVRVERLQDISEADAIAEGLYKSYPDDEDREWFNSWVEDRTGAPPTAAEIEDFEQGVWRVPGVPQGWGLTKEDRQRDLWAPTPKFAYQLIWEHINGKASWEANPWVWAVTFERVPA